jgi:hypothetical protein
VKKPGKVNQPHPDIFEIVRSFPERVYVRWHGNTYVYATCAVCSQKYWHRGSGKTEPNKMINRFYCSQRCQQSGYLELHILRQKRYHVRKRKGLV